LWRYTLSFAYVAAVDARWRPHDLRRLPLWRLPVPIWPQASFSYVSRAYPSAALLLLYRHLFLIFFIWSLLPVAEYFLNINLASSPSGHSAPSLLVRFVLFFFLFWFIFAPKRAEGLCLFVSLPARFLHGIFAVIGRQVFSLPCSLPPNLRGVCFSCQGSCPRRALPPQFFPRHLYSLMGCDPS